VSTRLILDPPQREVAARLAGLKQEVAGLSTDESVASARESIAQGNAEVAVCAELLTQLGRVAVGGGV
jgi:hypothetical protein